MSNIASKKQAVELIRRAVAAGWTREVTAQRLGVPGARPFSVLVCLSKTVEMHRGAVIRYAHVFVSFRNTDRRFGRMTVSINTRMDYDRKGKGSRGLWSANYAIADLKKEEASEYAVKPSTPAVQ